MGRPSKLTPETAHTAEVLAKLGFSDEKLASAMGIARSTLSEWKVSDPEFSATLKAAKAEADSQVIEGLFKRATGFVGPDGAFHAPHPTAAIFWLRNRQPEAWRDTNRHEVTGADGQPLQGPPLLELAPGADAALQKLIQDAQDRVRRPSLTNS